MLLVLLTQVMCPAAFDKHDILLLSIIPELSVFGQVSFPK